MDESLALAPSIAYETDDIAAPVEPIPETPGHCKLKINIQWVDVDRGNKVIAECVDERVLYHLLKSTQRADAPIRIQKAFDDIRGPLTTELLSYLEQLDADQAQVEPVNEIHTLDDISIE